MTSKHENYKVTSPFPFWISAWCPPHQLQRIYVAPHWHQGIELNYTARGNIADFVISRHHYHCSPGKILIVNSREIHGTDGYMGTDDEGVDIIYPYTLISALFPALDHYYIDINQPVHFNNKQRKAYRHLQYLLNQLVNEMVRSKQPQFRNTKVNALGMTILNNMPFRSLAMTGIKQEMIDRFLKLVG